MKISVVMPVYNDEEHLEDALNSIINQSLEDIEIICVNDASTDNSLKILKKFQKEYPNFIILSQDNLGPAIARNNALKHASGEYIAFLDSDDLFLDDNSLNLMYNEAIKYDADMISANIMGINLEGKIVKTYNLPYIEEYQTILPEDYGIPYSFYKNIFKRKFLLENKFVFPDIKRGEDPIFLANILTKVDKIYNVPVDFYGYRYSPNDSLDKINNYKIKYDYVKHFKDTFDILNENKKFSNTLSKYIETFYKYISYFDDNKKDIELYNIIQDVFENNNYGILDGIENYFYIPKISVIVPVYNVEKYLTESLNSLLHQTFDDYDIICINDGSTDKSLDLLKDFSSKNDKIKIVNQENCGCGCARNRGLKEACGEYIYFFDPDDLIEKNTLEKLYHNAINNNSDIVLFKYGLIYDNKNDNSNSKYDFEYEYPEINFEEHSFTYHDINHYVLNSVFAPWLKLYKRTFLEKYEDIKFPTNLAFDDVLFHVKSILRAKSISYVPEILYHYRVNNPNSVNNTSKNAFDIFRICDIVEEFLVKNDYYEEFESEFIKFKIYQILYYIISSNSEYYFKYAQNEFNKIHIKDEYNLAYDIQNDFNLVLSSNNYEEYRVAKNAPLIYDKENIDEIRVINKQLEQENKKIKEEYETLNLEKNDYKNKYNTLLSSNSWKITKPLRTVTTNMKKIFKR